MPFEFLLMRLPRSAKTGPDAREPEPQPIKRLEIRELLAEMPELRPGPDEHGYVVDLPTGPRIRVIVDPAEPPEFISVDFDRYDGQDDYSAARAIVDRLCEGLRLTISDDPDATAVVADEDESMEGGLLDRLRGMFRRPHRGA